MSYIVSIRRPISKPDPLKAIEGDEQLSIVSEGDNHVDFTWVSGEDRAEFNLSQGEITVTSPSDAARQKNESAFEETGCCCHRRGR